MLELVGESRQLGLVVEAHEVAALVEEGGHGHSDDGAGQGTDGEVAGVAARPLRQRFGGTDISAVRGRSDLES